MDEIPNTTEGERDLDPTVEEVESGVAPADSRDELEVESSLGSRGKSEASDKDSRRAYHMSADEAAERRRRIEQDKRDADEARDELARTRRGESASSAETRNEIASRDSRVYEAILTEERNSLIARHGWRGWVNGALGRIGFGEPILKPNTGKYEAEWRTYNTVNRGRAPYINYEDFVGKGYQDRAKWARD